MNRTLVIIVSYNGMKWIERCLCSVAMSTEKADIMVIDNASTDGTPEWI
ncbi:MAG: glycosyltransferase, partial [Bacteroidales bacterium]|nr:glycosyltransferase [Bacteroidales bacterium]